MGRGQVHHISRDETFEFVVSYEKCECAGGVQLRACITTGEWRGSFGMSPQRLPAAIDRTVFCEDVLDVPRRDHNARANLGWARCGPQSDYALWLGGRSSPSLRASGWRPTWHLADRPSWFGGAHQSNWRRPISRAARPPGVVSCGSEISSLRRFPLRHCCFQAR